MTKKHDDPDREQALKDEAAAEERYRKESKRPGQEAAPRQVKINLSPLAADAPAENTPFVQATNTDLETKKLFEALIDEIRRQGTGGGGGGEGGAGSAPASVKSDLNALRDAIMLTNASLDADTGVATTTYAEGNPPPLETV